MKILIIASYAGAEIARTIVDTIEEARVVLKAWIANGEVGDTYSIIEVE
jgi:hypothetical protein